MFFPVDFDFTIDRTLESLYISMFYSSGAPNEVQGKRNNLFANNLSMKVLIRMNEFNDCEKIITTFVACLLEHRKLKISLLSDLTHTVNQAQN